MKVKIPHKNANLAQTMTYLEAHQKFGHLVEEATRATAKWLGWKWTLQAENCKACSIGKLDKNIK